MSVAASQSPATAGYAGVDEVGRSSPRRHKGRDDQRSDPAKCPRQANERGCWRRQYQHLTWAPDNCLSGLRSSDLSWRTAVLSCPRWASICWRTSSGRCQGRSARVDRRMTPWRRQWTTAHRRIQYGMSCLTSMIESTGTLCHTSETDARVVAAASRGPRCRRPPPELRATRKLTAWTSSCPKRSWL